MSSALVFYFSDRTEIVVIVMLKHGIVYAAFDVCFAPNRMMQTMWDVEGAVPYNAPLLMEEVYRMFYLVGTAFAAVRYYTKGHPQGAPLRLR